MKPISPLTAATTSQQPNIRSLENFAAKNSHPIYVPKESSSPLSSSLPNNKDQSANLRETVLIGQQDTVNSHNHPRKRTTAQKDRAVASSSSTRGGASKRRVTRKLASANTEDVKENKPPLAKRGKQEGATKHGANKKTDEDISDSDKLDSKRQQFL